MSEVVWTEPALAHLEAIRAYIAKFNPKAAHEVAASLKATGNSLANFPHRGRPVVSGWVGYDLKKIARN